MKKRKSLFSINVIAACCYVILLGCTDRYRGMSINEMEHAKPFSAKIERIVVENLGDKSLGLVVFIGLRCSDGKRFGIGEENSTNKSFAEFAQTLKKDRIYEFPTVWLEFKTNIVLDIK